MKQQEVLIQNMKEETSHLNADHERTMNTLTTLQHAHSILEGEMERLRVRLTKKQDHGNQLEKQLVDERLEKSDLALK